MAGAAEGGPAGSDGMKTDIVLAGVGGQGILTVAYLLDNCAVDKGLRFKQAEVHGMAQRGGAVYSHMRLSDSEIISDLIPEGRADMILSVEPLEVQRYLHFLAGDGVVVTNIVPEKNIPDYPDDDAIMESLYALPRCVLVDAKAIATEAGNPRGENMAMVGAATPFLPFGWRDFEPLVQRLFGSKGEKVVVANMKVLETGYNIGEFSRRLFSAGVSNRVTGMLMTRVLPMTVDPELAGQFATAINDEGRAIAVLAGILEKVPCDLELANRLR